MEHVRVMVQTPLWVAKAFVDGKGVIQSNTIVEQCTNQWVRTWRIDEALPSWSLGK